MTKRAFAMQPMKVSSPQMRDDVSFKYPKGGRHQKDHEKKHFFHFLKIILFSLFRYYFKLNFVVIHLRFRHSGKLSNLLTYFIFNKRIICMKQ